MATKKKPTQLDRIEAKLDTLLSGAAFMQELEKAKEEPQPEGLQPGDYTEASKEVADALTEMKIPTYSKNTLNHYDWPAFEWRGGGYLVGCTNGSQRSIPPAEFLSRAAVTAKEIGLVSLAEQGARKPVVPYVTRVKYEGYEWRVISGPDEHGDYHIHRMVSEKKGLYAYPTRNEFTVID